MTARPHILAGLCLLSLAIGGCDNAGFSGSSNNTQKEKEKPAADTATSNETSGKTKPVATATVTATATATATATDTALGTSVTPPPSNAITQGSFTVWAVPNNPQPLEDYQIYLTATLPANVAANFQENDLTGSIQGTDGYTQDLGQSIKHGGNTGVIDITTLTQVNPQFSVANGKAQLMIWVPGAQSKVDDTVMVHSNLLNETQNIQIHFQ